MTTEDKCEHGVEIWETDCPACDIDDEVIKLKLALEKIRDEGCIGPCDGRCADIAKEALGDKLDG